LFFKTEADANRAQNLYADAVKELAVLQRSAIVNRLYGGWKLAVEVQEKQRHPEVIKDRGDN